MKTLYISDLDGTLLTPECELSDETAGLLNSMVEKGLLFTVATARSASSAAPLLAKLRLRLPVILMNGVVIYDLAHQKPVSVCPIAADAARAAVAVFEHYGKCPFFNRMNQNKLEICFTQLKPEINRKYYEDRKHSPDKRFIAVDRLTVTEETQPIYLTTFDRYEELVPVARDISGIEGLSHVFYKDTYSDYWLIEVFSSKASKPAGTEWIKRLTGASRLVAFGDNLNDLPLFAAADASYAVSNAHERVRKAATGVIASNTENAVARFLYQNVSFYEQEVKNDEGIDIIF